MNSGTRNGVHTEEDPSTNEDGLQLIFHAKKVVETPLKG
jgi:hypothetical protein